jgi:hypothetical protein
MTAAADQRLEPPTRGALRGALSLAARPTLAGHSGTARVPSALVPLWRERPSRGGGGPANRAPLERRPAQAERGRSCLGGGEKK